jgi:BMFP domain-containing protein YqiC
VGEIYAEFIDAKIVEQRERAAAYQRVAARARQHAEKLDTTVALFEAADTENSVPMNRLAVD